MKNSVTIITFLLSVIFSSHYSTAAIKSDKLPALETTEKRVAKKNRRQQRMEKRFDRFQQKLTKKFNKWKKKNLLDASFDLRTISWIIIALGGLFILLGLIIPFVGFIFTIIGAIIAFAGLITLLLFDGVSVSANDDPPRTR